MQGGAYESLLWEHKKIYISIMDMWPEAATGRLAESLHLTAAQPLTQQQQQTHITLVAEKPFSCQKRHTFIGCLANPPGSHPWHILCVLL